MKYKKIIFLDKNGTARAPMAKSIFNSFRAGFNGEVLARGLVVAFPEPMNPKAQAIIVSDGIDVSGYSSERINNNDITEDTIILTIDENIRDGAINSLENATPENTFEICKIAKEELQIMDPYGGTLQTYGLCYESMKNIIKKVIEVLEGDNE